MRVSRAEKIQKRRHENARVIAYVIAVVLCLGLLVNAVTPTVSYSKVEGRKLAKGPRIGAETMLSGSFGHAFEEYYRDQFIGRGLWKGLDFITKYATGQRVFGTIYEGKDGYLLRMPTEEEGAFEANIRAINAFVDAHEKIDMTAIFVPSAIELLEEALPVGAIPPEETNLYAGLADRVVTADVRSALRATAQEEVQIYYHTEPYWTSEGAEAVFWEAVPTLDVETDGVRYSDEVISEDFRGQLARACGDFRRKDSIRVYTPVGEGATYELEIDGRGSKKTSFVFEEALATEDQYAVFLGGSRGPVDVETEVDNDRSLLIIGDGHMNSFVQFLTPYYHRIALIDPAYYDGKIETVLSECAVTDVLFLFGQETLTQEQAFAKGLD